MMPAVFGSTKSRTIRIIATSVSLHLRFSTDKAALIIGRLSDKSSILPLPRVLRFGQTHIYHHQLELPAAASPPWPGASTSGSQWVASPPLISTLLQRYTVPMDPIPVVCLIAEGDSMATLHSIDLALFPAQHGHSNSQLQNILLRML